MLDLLGTILVTGGIPFFFAGTVGMLRFPDLYSRLHALTKADNMGLGLVALGMALQAQTVSLGLIFIAIWLLVLLASAVGSYLLAHHAYSQEIKPWLKH